MKKQCISKDWYLKTFHDSSFQKVDLPNDYIIGEGRDENATGGGHNGFFKSGTGRYVKYIEIPENPLHYILDIDGAYMCAEVWENDELLAIHPHGYTPFLVNLTPKIVYGTTNKLAISTNAIQPSTRWYSGGGLYRDVYLWTGGVVRVEPWDVFITTPEVSEKEALVSVSYGIRSDISAEATLRAYIKDAVGNIVGGSEKVLFVSECEKTDVNLQIAVKEPKLWNIGAGYLYTVETEIWCNGELTDSAENTFGIRSIRVSTEKGFELNGKSIKLRGGCIHHDHGVLGAAAFPAAEERKVRKLIDAGFNALRISHYPPSLALLEICDRLGVIVMDEAFDMWNIGKTECDYHLWFADWYERDISYMVRRDRNHPCVAAYSIGNEIREYDSNSDGAKWASKLAVAVRKYDTTRPVTCAVCGFWRKQEETDTEEYIRDIRDKKFNRFREWGECNKEVFTDLDMVGYNYGFHRYDEDGSRYPERIIWGSESHTLNFFDGWNAVLQNAHVLGDFTWTAYDNLGEAGTGRYLWARDGVIPGISIAEYPWRTCYQGDLDLCGFRRPQSYFREAIWIGNTEPKIFTTHPEHYGEDFTGTCWHWHDVLDSWTFDERYIGCPVKCEVYTDADKIEWFLNGRFLGESVPEKAIAEYTVHYEKGILSVKAYKNGVLAGTSSLQTVGKASRIVIRPEKDCLKADNRDLCYFQVYVMDTEGRRVPDAASHLTCSVTGGELLGIFSGDPKNEDVYGSATCHAYTGRAIAVVRTSLPGRVNVTIYSKELAGASCSVIAE